MKERNVKGIGIDTGSLDAACAGGFPVHETILGADRYQIENMKLAEVPAGLGVTFISLPLKIKDGPEAETRVMAILAQ